VDDLKISHKDTKVVDQVIASLKEEYEQIGEMTVRRRKVHDHLGMTLDFSKPCKPMIDMQSYLGEVFEYLRRSRTSKQCIDILRHQPLIICSKPVTMQTYSALKMQSYSTDWWQSCYGSTNADGQMWQLPYPISLHKGATA
jgi:hypothetical protein